MSNEIIKAQKSAMEVKISAIAGADVELTVRGDRSFTFTIEGVNQPGARKVMALFSGHAKTWAKHDEECACSFVYVDLLNKDAAIRHPLGVPA